jgi:hypothetical protein
VTEYTGTVDKAAEVASGELRVARGCLGLEPSPRFFVNVASKEFKSGVSPLDATVADGRVGIDSKAAAGGRSGVLNGSVWVDELVGLNTESTEFTEKGGRPPTRGYPEKCEVSA